MDYSKSALKVNEGIEQPPIINEKAVEKFKKLKKRQLSVAEYVEQILKGEITVLSQAITLIESSLPAHQAIAREIIEKCLPYSGKSIRIGITGVPGVGKSTFIEALGVNICKQGNKLAVLAIDPSSERTGGSILGDKTRMEKLSLEPKAFIRPSPSAGSLGGVARKTRESIILCEAASFNTIFVETVGVGQSETAVHSMVDFFLLLMLAGAGDELQGIKRGIMEMADAIAITKSDGENINKAKIARVQYKNALHLFPPSDSGWNPEVLCCSAIDNSGIDELWNLIISYFKFATETNFIDTKRQLQAKYWMHESIVESLKTNFYNNSITKDRIQTFEKEVLEGRISSFHAANQLLFEYFQQQTK